LFDDGFEGLGFLDGHIGEDFAVQFDIGGVEAFDKSAVADAFGADGGIQSVDPKGAEIALFGFAVPVGPGACLVDSVLSVAEEFAARPAEAFGFFDDAFTTSARGRGIGGSWHGLFSMNRLLVSFQVPYLICSVDRRSLTLARQGTCCCRAAVGCIIALLAAAGVSMEWQVGLYIGDVRCRDKSGFPQITFPFAVFVLEKVPFALFPAQYFAGAGDFKSFGNSFASFGDTSFASHRATNLGSYEGDARRKLKFSAVGPFRHLNLVGIGLAGNGCPCGLWSFGSVVALRFAYGFSRRGRRSIVGCGGGLRNGI